MAFLVTPSWRSFDRWVHEVFGGSIPSRVAIRVDASRKEGLSYGHAARCLIMARALKRLGGEALFVMQDYSDGVSFVEGKGFTVLTVGERGGFDETLRIAADMDADWLIVDIPYPESDIARLEAANAPGFGVVFLDDSRFLFPRVEAVLNSSIRALDKTPDASHGPRRTFLGPSYFILDGAGQRPARRRDDRAKVLLTFGGSDPTDLTLRALRALNRRDWPHVRFTVVLGPGYKESREVAREARSSSRCAVLRAPADLMEIMAGHDLVVCAGGRTMYEAWALDVAFLPVASAPHEALEVRAFLRRGLTPFGLEDWNEFRFLDAFNRTLHGLRLAGSSWS